MYNTNVLPSVYSSKIFAAGIRFYELIKHAMKPSRYKDNNSKEYLPYILNAVVKGYTVLDIGSHKRAYFIDLFKIAKFPGKLIAFERDKAVFNYLQKMKRLLHFQNIVLEQFLISKENEGAFHSNASTTKDQLKSAPVIDFRARTNRAENEEIKLGIIDHYCFQNFVIPALIKIKLGRSDVDVLQGAKQVMQKYKPKILIECSEGMVGREALLQAFSFLAGLHYTGYFILDTIKVPLANFDFNIYQNEVLGYYCNNFIFE